MALVKQNASLQSILFTFDTGGNMTDVMGLVNVSVLDNGVATRLGYLGQASLFALLTVPQQTALAGIAARLRTAALGLDYPAPPAPP